MTDIYKLIIVGDENVGKTSLITRFTNGFYAEDYKTTIGVDFLFKELHYKEKDIKLFIWDITGQERFRFLTNIYYNKVIGAIVVFDLHYKDSFIHCEDWLNNIYEKGTNIKDRIVLVGAKADKEPVVLSSEIDKLCKKHNIKYAIMMPSNLYDVMACIDYASFLNYLLFIKFLLPVIFFLDGFDFFSN